RGHLQGQLRTCLQQVPFRRILFVGQDKPQEGLLPVQVLVQTLFVLGLEAIGRDGCRSRA
ncbi:MAG: hypothetical protein D6790_17375, partial [Caldilineae bacterium]